MARGGRAKLRDGPERRCLATGASGPVEGLIRFALSPQGEAVPDLAEKLPGRGVWVSARRDAVQKVAAKRLFSRGFRQPVKAPDDLAERLEAALAQRLVEAISLARKAGLATTGFEKVKARLKSAAPVAALIEASDGAEGGKAKLRPLAGEAASINTLTADELGLAFGREFVIHACLDPGGAAARVVREQRRLSGFRSPTAASAAQETAGPPGASGPDGA